MFGHPLASTWREQPVTSALDVEGIPRRPRVQTRVDVRVQPQVVADRVGGAGVREVTCGQGLRCAWSEVAYRGGTILGGAHRGR